mmetsp:Transcript_124376/g.359630  ORF Transcript_124376/g.359630 Transcript_124376/m.359630 type:complete len:361 (+) Transcript_124376:490-1572(+)
MEDAIIGAYSVFSDSLVKVNSISVVEAAGVVSGDKRRLAAMPGNIIVDFTAWVKLKTVKSEGVSEQSIKVSLTSGLDRSLQSALAKHKDKLGTDLSRLPLVLDSFMTHQHVPGVVYSSLDDFVEEVTEKTVAAQAVVLTTGHIIGLIASLSAIGGWVCVRKRRRARCAGAHVFIRREMEHGKMILWTAVGQRRRSFCESDSDVESPRARKMMSPRSIIGLSPRRRTFGESDSEAESPCRKKASSGSLSFGRSPSSLSFGGNESDVESPCARKKESQGNRDANRGAASPHKLSTLAGMGRGAQSPKSPNGEFSPSHWVAPQEWSEDALPQCEGGPSTLKGFNEDIDLNGDAEPTVFMRAAV